MEGGALSLYSVKTTQPLISLGLFCFLAEDPVKMFDYPRTCPDSVLKFLADIFSSRVTSGFFYTSDMMVLLEIVLRQLADLSPGNKVRQLFGT